MKRMIITPRQLKAINEAVATYDGTADGFIRAAGEEKAKGNLTGGTISFVSENPPENAANNAFTGDPDVASGSSTVTMPAKALDKINTLEESHYTKRQVELGRMLEMRRTGKVFSKRQLNEMFMESEENVQMLMNGIGDCFIHDIFSAVGNVFGPDAEDEMKDRLSNGEDPQKCLSDIFQNFDSDEQEKFLAQLGIIK